jgi:hypothetical protein
MVRLSVLADSYLTWLDPTYSGESCVFYTGPYITYQVVVKKALEERKRL